MGVSGTYKKADKQLQRVSKTIGAIMVIVTAIVGLFGWVSTQFKTFVSDQISELKDELKQTEVEHEQTMSRIELMMLMEEDPDNTTAIEKIATHYFQDLDGDLYMTKKYSEWAHVYGGDINIATRR